MSVRARRIVTLVGAVVVAAMVWKMSGTTWGRSGAFPVARRVLQTAGLPGAGEGTYRLLLTVPFDEKEMREVMVTREIIEAVQEGDVLEFRSQRLPGIGIQATEFRATRNFVRVTQWEEGFPILYAGIGAAGVLGGILFLGLATAAAHLLRMNAPPEV
jgi:hypothetical protein